jgi:hypothetical protein
MTSGVIWMRAYASGKLVLERLDDTQEVAAQVVEATQHTFDRLYNGAMYFMSDPSINQVKNKLISLGQDILIAGAGVMVVAAGIFIIIGMKREGMRRFLDQIQGLAVGLIGPAVIGGVAMFFISIAKGLTA